MSGYREEFGRASRDVYWTVPRVLGLVVLLMLVGTGLSLLGQVLGLFGGAVNSVAVVVQKEFYPEALLRKYEWFKDASAALDKKQADITIYDRRLTDLGEAYKGTARKDWPRDDREQYSIWASEAAGIRASYNQLASEYNSEMSKFNWRFTNVGDVPQGGKPLPREYRTYIEQ